MPRWFIWAKLTCLQLHYSVKGPPGLILQKMTPPGLILQWKAPPGLILYWKVPSGLISLRPVDTVIEIPREYTTWFRIQLLLDHKSVKYSSQSFAESMPTVCERDIYISSEILKWSFAEYVRSQWGVSEVRFKWFSVFCLWGRRFTRLWLVLCQ